MKATPDALKNEAALRDYERACEIVGAYLSGREGVAPKFITDLATVLLDLGHELRQLRWDRFPVKVVGK